MAPILLLTMKKSRHLSMCFDSAASFCPGAGASANRAPDSSPSSLSSSSRHPVTDGLQAGGVARVLRASRARMTKMGG
ncbi:hypothetical protein AC579_3963 [Pseudocercospora musae]|uniref:Uncharacterized protein n=1 Tax=Pseudocercospora musae TaxID=113226 RepID=A0A139I1S1_9PEZI|nr:hypothetical protein AC579_3963 [Pseudocercospora musae]KXT08671.1 hypothetical protein AC579_3963 [Pseudocercospora musae]